jgi:tetratricopeptide (TPR) repeat protein
LELIHVLLHPGVRLRDPGELARDLAELCAAAQRLGLESELSRGLSLLARVYHWGWGDIPRARALLQRATTLIEQAHEPNLEPLLEAARCLAYLEMDMDRTARLFDQLGGLHGLADESFQYQWGLGLVQAWRGDVGSARAALGRAADLAAARSEHWVAFECTARLALLELEAGDVDAAGPLCVQLATLASKLGEGSERPYAAAVAALYGVARRDPEGTAALDDAVTRLERIDARFLVPDILGIAAELYYRAGSLDLARELAERAMGVGDNVSRPFESARAHALLARIAMDRGDPDEARRQVGAINGTDGLPVHVQALRRDAVALLQREQGVDAWP